MRLLALICLCSIALVASACGGDSSAEKAKTQACDARADIQKQIDTLKGLPLAAGSIDTAKTAVTAIRTDLQQIDDAAPDLKGELKGQLEQANSTFKATLQTIADKVDTSSSLPDITAALTTAGTDLQAAYQSAFANVKC